MILSGDTMFMVENQFFQITSQFAADGLTPLYFCHDFGQPVSGAKVLNLDGSLLTPAPVVFFSGNRMYHDVALSSPCLVRYANALGQVQTGLLHYTQALSFNPNGDIATGYVLAGGVITLSFAARYAIRFTTSNGYQVLSPYEVPSYLPWYPRVRFPLLTPAVEYPNQNFTPAWPYMVGYWAHGVVLAENIIQFDRQALSDPTHAPDILVFDSDGGIKYAMDGAADASAVEARGTLYNWRRRQVTDLDSFSARVQVIPALEPTDKVYGFYPYAEPDVVYTALDVNPVTNTEVKNATIVFYYRTDDADPQRAIYHQVSPSFRTPKHLARAG